MPDVKRKLYAISLNFLARVRCPTEIPVNWYNYVSYPLMKCKNCALWL